VANELILIVDADAKSRGVLDVSLKKAGYRVQTFERGHDALAWLDGGSAPSLVICEAASAGGMTGLALCSKVREDAAHEELPFMILTDGAPSTELRRRAGELGVEDFLSRPRSRWPSLTARRCRASWARWACSTSSKPSKSAAARRSSSSPTVLGAAR
jgi:CheY-like chemotaxis protein